MVTKKQLIELIKADHSLSDIEKKELEKKLNDDAFFDRLMHGAIGASLAYVITKFLGLSKKAQMLLSIAGFGVGRYLLDESRKHDKVVEYQKETKTYKIK